MTFVQGMLSMQDQVRERGGLQQDDLPQLWSKDVLPLQTACQGTVPYIITSLFLIGNARIAMDKQLEKNDLQFRYEAPSLY
jgi:hypothetical protein